MSVYAKLWKFSLFIKNCTKTLKIVHADSALTLLVGWQEGSLHWRAVEASLPSLVTCWIKRRLCQWVILCGLAQCFEFHSVL